MGICSSTNLTAEEKAMIETANALEKKIKASQTEDERILKVLLLGTYTLY